MLVVLVQLALAGSGALACVDHSMPPMTGSAHVAMASTPMADMADMPSHEGDRSSHDGDCPESGMPSDECQAMSACSTIVAIATDVSLAAATASPSDASRGAQLAPRSLALAPESPPPRA